MKSFKKNLKFSVSPDAKLLTGFPLRKNQIQAMFIKKFISTKRSWVTFLMMLLIPVIFICMTIAIVRSQPDPASMPPLFIELNSYRNPVTVLEGSMAANDFYGRYVESSTAFLKLCEEKRVNIFSILKLSGCHEPINNYTMIIARN